MVDPRRARAHSISCAAICDAMIARHRHRAHLVGLVSPLPSRRLAGPAVTMRFLPLRRDLVGERHEFGALLREAVVECPDAAVLVASSAGHPDGALAGGKKLARIRNLGLDGMVCDGAVRDFAEVDALGIGVWCRGEAVRNANDLLMPWEVNVPVEVGGLTVVAGDWVFADASGVVVVPADEVDGVLADAEALEARDGAEVARVRAQDEEWRLSQGRGR